MDPLLPTEIFALEVQPGETVPVIDAPASFRITMAAIDPTAPAIPDPEHPNAPPRATLKMIRHYEPIEFDDDEDDDEDDEDIDEEDVAAIERKLGLELGEDSEDDDEEDSEDEAGPSDPAKVQKARAAAAKKLANGVDDDVDMAELPNGVNGVKKGKAKAIDDDEEEDDDEDLEDIDDEFGDEDDVELPLCTLDTAQHYQQALDLTVMDTSTVSFKVIGTHSIFLTGNFVEVPEDDDSEDDEDDEDDYIDDLDRLVAPYDDEEEDEEIDSEEDELDDLDDPRIKEIDSDEEDAAPKLVKAKATPLKGKNKRPAESEDEEADDLDNLISKTLKSGDAQTNGEQKLSKKQLKKLKKNDGQAALTAAAEEKKAVSKDSPGNGKKVQFAKELEQGPTPTKADAKGDAKKDTKSQGKGIRVVQGVTVDERKEGSGPGAKKGDRVSMRYIGKLEKDNKVFDSNKKGKPFTFKLGMQEVIKGWDVGLVGIKVGSERRLTIPASMAYGSQRLPDIPPNSSLVFDVKCLSIN